MLADRNVVLGITGSIAAVKTVELAHELRRRGATVRALMTPAATELLDPWAVEYATGHEPVTELTGAVEHVHWCGRDGWADVFVIAPATANTVGKIAAGIDDTPVTTAATTALGADLPIVLAPAMHEPMYDHPGVDHNLAQLRDWGLSIVPPRIEEGKAKIATIDAIATATARAATPSGPLTEQHLVVTAGATGAPIDPVRVLTNRASGRMGRQLAKAGYARGATVTLVHGQVGPQPVTDSGLDSTADDPTIPGVDLHSVETTAEMIETVETVLPEADALLSAAAIGDYTTTYTADKLRSGDPRTLELQPTPKLLDHVREQAPTLPIVGFKAESTTDDSALVSAARSLRDRVDATFVVANATEAMGATTTKAILVDDTTTTVHGSKAELALAIVDELGARIV